MTYRHARNRRLALDGEAMLEVLAGPVERWAGVRPETCLPSVLQRGERRLVVRYDLAGPSGCSSVVGKWYDSEQGATSAGAIERLHELATTGFGARVPALVVYRPELRLLVTEAVDGPTLQDAAIGDPGVVALAGRWLAQFHAQAPEMPRACGPDRQQRAVTKRVLRMPGLGDLGALLEPALAGLPVVARPVHYDYHPGQLVLSPGGLVGLDLDEVGMGDPSFDVAHFRAHLRLLAFRELGDPAGLVEAEMAFRTGYESVAPLPPRRAPLDAYAYFKLAYLLAHRGAADAEVQFAARCVQRHLALA